MQEKLYMAQLEYVKVRFMLGLSQKWLILNVWFCQAHAI
jgi:hypothetical protein